MTVTNCTTYEVVPQEVPMKCTKGNTLPVTGTMTTTSAAGVTTAVDLAGATAVFVVEQEDGTDVYKGTAFTMNAGSVTGAFSLVVPAATTATWTATKYKYALTFTFPDGTVYTVAYGPIRIEQYAS